MKGRPHRRNPSRGGKRVAAMQLALLNGKPPVAPAEAEPKPLDPAPDWWWPGS